MFSYLIRPLIYIALKGIVNNFTF